MFNIGIGVCRSGCNPARRSRTRSMDGRFSHGLSGSHAVSTRRISGAFSECASPARPTPWSQPWHTGVPAHDKRQIRFHRRGTDGLSTHRWRETDSNRWSLAEKKKASSGSSTPRVRLGPQRDKGAKPCSLLREPENNIPAAPCSGIACRQALQDYRHFP